MTFDNGAWYCVGWKLDDGSIQYDDLIQYEDGAFFNENGDEITHLFCPVLQLKVSPFSADIYQKQV